ncbi:gliding motility-associated protein GldE [Membranihabitans maritimus]|uniref:gliding motility-associated protein GldE n=1 Tax=Membranihabitans maritimus TaxID=2904244 RepID=UPI001F01BB73|nr:gliding motility-associated protein GldE [Membranihabitans maritimus]
MEADHCSLVITYLFQTANVALAVQWSIILGVSILLFLLLCSALVSGSEVAYFSISPNDIEFLQHENSKSSERIIKLKQNPRHLLASILISNNFINIAIVLISEYLVGIIFPYEKLFQWALGLSDWLSFIGNNYASIAITMEFLITVLGVTALLVLFGEVLPKIYANTNNLELAKMTSWPLTMVSRILHPVSHQMVRWTMNMENRLSGRRTVHSLASKQEIDAAIDITIQRTNKAEAEVSLLKRIVKFSDTYVKQIMTTRTDITSIDEKTPFPEVYEIVKQCGFSRIPVYSGDLDNIQGILYVKDLLQYMDDTDFNWQKILRKEVLYVPETKRINELLKEFQLERKHMAIVVDEYGGSSGIVTLEDIMEEVVGDIRDEFDMEEELDYKKIGKNTFEFDGKFLINDACRVLKIDSEYFDFYKGESDSIAGLLLEVLGRMPRKDEEIQFREYKFKVISVNKKRIEKIQLTKTDV